MDNDERQSQSRDVNTGGRAPLLGPVPPAWHVRFRERTTHLREFVREPALVGAVAPSSPKLAAAVSAIIPSQGDPVVVELGPGTGAFTDAIQGKLGGRGRHLAIEQNLSMASLLRERHKRVDVVQASAQHLPQILVTHQIPQVDIVVSGLPWVSLPASVAEATLEAITSFLAPDGVFTTFGYSFARSLAPAQRFRQQLINGFEEVVISRTVLQNIPPAFVYYARRPRPITARELR